MTKSFPNSADRSKTLRARPRPPFECIALLLQGGGALGAYQAGVYEALAEADLQPDWVAGISIGAINGALIAGNAPEVRVDKLRTFWGGVTKPVWDWSEWANSFLTMGGDAARQAIARLAATPPALREALKKLLARKQ